jgi:L-aminopeptidase/D-esterase-like protein
VVLAGGSSYGLAAADGASAWLGARGRGFRLATRDGVPASPIVPAAILYDLANGGDKSWGEEPPYRMLGLSAAAAAASAPVRLGRAGAGFGAIAGAEKGGLGSASFVTDDGFIVGAIVAVNSFGSARRPGSRAFWAAPFELDQEFGGYGEAPNGGVADWPPDTKVAAASARANTTIGVVAVNASLGQAEARRLAIMAQDGLARAIRPAHGPTDGDAVFALAAGPKPAADPITLTRLGLIAADCLARAIARGVYEAARLQSQDRSA